MGVMRDLQLIYRIKNSFPRTSVPPEMVEELVDVLIALLEREAFPQKRLP